MYTKLDAARILETSRALEARVSERFPGSGLGRVAAELTEVSERATATASWLARPHWPLRGLAALGILGLVLVIGGALRSVAVPTDVASLSDLLQASEAAINEVVFLSLAVFFLLTLETRRKRARALEALHVLRSLAHIIDMHQLTKDPDRVLARGRSTESSPRHALTRFELTRYLDYCSEALSIVSKIAALYVQELNDPVTVSAVNDIEQLTTGLSRKIWQKIMILDRVVAPGPHDALA